MKGVSLIDKIAKWRGLFSRGVAEEDRAREVTRDWIKKSVFASDVAPGGTDEFAGTTRDREIKDRVAGENGAAEVFVKIQGSLSRAQIAMRRRSSISCDSYATRFDRTR